MTHTIQITVEGRANSFTDIYKLSNRIDAVVQDAANDWEGESSSERKINTVKCEVNHGTITG